MIMISVSCIAQRITLSRSTTLEMPNQMIKVSKSNVSKIASNKFGKTKYLLQTIQNHPDRIFTVGEMVILVNSVEVPQNKGVLKRLKAATDDVFHDDKSYSSNIVPIDGKDVLIINHINEGLNIIRFTTFNPSENFSVTGFIQYPLKDYDKAKATLKNIITGLIYTN